MPRLPRLPQRHRRIQPCPQCIARQQHQHHNRRHVRQHRQQARRNRQPQPLRHQVQDAGEAEQIGAQQQPPHPPTGKYHQRQGNPATPGSHVFRPHRRVRQRQIRPGQPGHRAAEKHRQGAHGQHRQAHRTGRIRVLADRLNDQPDTAFDDHPRHQRKQPERQIHQQILREQHPPDQRDFTQIRNRQRLESSQWFADPRRPHESRQPHAKNRQGQPGRYLIGVEHQRHQSKQRRQQHPGEHRQQYAEPQVAAVERDDKTDHRTKQHHPFLPEVEHAALLADQFTQRHQQQRRAATHHREENIAQQIDIHHSAPAVTVGVCVRRAQRRFRRGR